MDSYQHHVSGFFARREDAERALSRLVDGGLARDQVQIIDTDRAPEPVQPVAGSHQVLMDVLKDGAIGTAVGTGVGVLTQLALVAANVSLFVASPLIAPLALLGWGQSRRVHRRSGRRRRAERPLRRSGSGRDFFGPGRAAGRNPDRAGSRPRPTGHRSRRGRL